MRIGQLKTWLAGLCGLVASMAAASSAWAQIPATACGTTVWPLTAGRNIPVGTITVANDTNNVYVAYAIDPALDPDASLGTMHLWIDNISPTDPMTTLPLSGGGAPIPGQFPYQFTPATGTTSYTFVIPFSSALLQDVGSICPSAKTLYVVAHAEVNNVGGDSGGIGGSGQTAFGGPTCYNNNPTCPTGGRWWFYGAYTTCCVVTPPPTIPVCTTAFGKGGYVFVTDDAKSNPEGLPSLDLIRNRWGWAVNLTAPGNYVYDIWAGAGLNYTSKGKLAGQLSVNWDGLSARITYAMVSGYSMSEAHVYAADTPPTTAAPGQYGFTRYFDPRVPTFTRNVSLEDTDGDGVWIIAHAVVCK